ncbi:Protein CASP [Choanephora cucurbitarum]|uniref:Protein CASP n=1 Tax=Choanephora cucurbitarum TaxID=101091 RepID=A0A1C7NI31_9FUNG|nr:Protein CASP [Choanephora cucurbitarum]
MSQESFSSAIQYWKSIQLVGLQKELDQQGLAIVENQKDGLVSRKKLAEQTREFKKIPDEEKVSKFKPLLKGYQTEIDNITKRTKYAENAFLTVYKLLADAPDPVPLFEAAIDSSVQQEDTISLRNENTYLKEQLEQTKETSKQLSTLEKTNEELVQKVAQLEEALNQKKANKKDHLEQEMKEQYSDKIKQYKEREYDLQKQLNQALDQLTELKHSHDDTQAQLINHGQKYDEEVIGKLAELDMVTMDLERANGRIAHLEKKNEDLKQELAQLSGSQHESKHENYQHNAEVNKLIKDVETYKDLYKSTEARLTKKIKDLTGENQALLEERDNLKKKIKGYEDYDEIKRELQIMKFVEFSTGEEDGDFNATDVLKKEAVHDSLEVRLMEKNKKLENDYTQVKMALVDLQKEFEQKVQEVDKATKALKEKTTLVQRLEEDLLRLGQQSNHNNLSIGSMSPLHRPKTPEGSLTPHTKDEKSILPIVMSQRDRFRQRNAELEERTRALETSLYDARTEVQNLKADNLKLYERLKFVHVWKEGELVNQRSSVAVNMDSSEPSSYPTRSFRRSSLKADDPSDKYGKLYEESMNPFTQFHKKEENRRYNALNPIEKLTLQLTRLLFSHKWSRYFFIMYSLLLHFLVVLTLYQLSLWECRHDHEAIQFPTNNDGLNRNSNGEV